MRRLAEPPEAQGRIIVATQVIEAGVDLSARTLISELAPLPSLIQRFGRCNRRGEYEDACVFWIDPARPSKGRAQGKAGIDESSAAPYAIEDLEAARSRLLAGDITEVGLRVLDGLDIELSDYEPAHVIRRKDLVELFDTTPDLAGNDIDVGRFVRDGDDLDVQVYWRQIGETRPSPEEPEPIRDELCAVQFSAFRDDFLKKGRDRGKIAWRWDPLEESWAMADDGSVFPGQVYLIPADCGGYDPELGWDAKADDPVPPVGPPPGAEPQPSYDGDEESRVERWQDIAGHTDEVVAAVEQIVGTIPLDANGLDALRTAARWHDWGKVHPVFQGAVRDHATDGEPRPPEWQGCRRIAKAPKKPRNFWEPEYRRELGPGDSVPLPHFRHELASALAMIQFGHSTLAVYLAAASHGKVRLSIRSFPKETRPRDRLRRFARGVWDGDILPAVPLGGGIEAPLAVLSLDVMELGRGESGPSWAERMLSLRDDPEIGPFRLAFLETILRAADMRASAGLALRPRGNDA